MKWPLQRYWRPSVGIVVVMLAAFLSAPICMDWWFAARYYLGTAERKPNPEVAVVFIDDTDTNYTSYTELLRKLAGCRAKAVVFDLVFDSDQWSQTNVISELTAAVSNAVQTTDLKVVFAADGYEKAGVKQEFLPSPEIVNLVLRFGTNAAIGVNNLGQIGGAIRHHSSRIGYFHKPLVVAATECLNEGKDSYEQWINYYGPPGTLPWFNLKTVLTNDLLGALKGKVVFVGQGPAATTLPSARDRHRTPLTRFPSTLFNRTFTSSGVEIHATAYSNLINGDFLAGPSDAEVLILVCVSILTGILFPLLTPVRAILVAAVVVTIVSCLLWQFPPTRFNSVPWFPILLVPQMLAGCAVSLIPVKEAFVSYRSADGKDAAVRIAEGLKQVGIEAFVDRREPIAGRLEKVLFPAIAKRRNFILVLTEKVLIDWGPMTADWVHAEIFEANRLQAMAESGICKRVVLPVYVDGIKVNLSPLFSEPEIKDVSSLVARLNRHVDDVSEYLFKRFSDDIPVVFFPAQASVQDVVRELNRIITGPPDSLYEASKTGGVSPFAKLLSQESKDLLAKNPTGPDLVLLNRMLLEDAYPLCIQKKALLDALWTALKNAKVEFNSKHSRASEFDILDIAKTLKWGIRGFANPERRPLSWFNSQ